MIEAEQTERQRLERNLHDGAQQRLVALSLDLSRLEAQLGDDPETRARVEHARGQIASSLAELPGCRPGDPPGRRRARTVLPSRSKSSSWPDRSRSVSTIDLDDERLPEAVEVAAYYVVCESLANIGKHAHATSATVTVGAGQPPGRRRDRG